MVGKQDSCSARRCTADCCSAGLLLHGSHDPVHAAHGLSAPSHTAPQLHWHSCLPMHGTHWASQGTGYTQAHGNLASKWLVCCAVLCRAVLLLHGLWCAGNPAAERVLDELLMSCCCREERATLLPEAFMPPGLEVRTQHAPPPSPPALHSSPVPQC